MRKLIVFIFLALSITTALSSQPINNKNIYGRDETYLTLVDSEEGIDRIVTIESVGQFRLVFEAADNWGISQWYDLVNDPDAATNLAFSNFEEQGVQEPGLFQMVWYGTNPNDPKLYMFAAKYFWPDAERSFTILENTPQRIVVEAVSHPLLAAGVLTNVTVAVKYYIYPDGKLYITAKMSVIDSQTIDEWRCAVIGLCDPTQTTYTGTPDSHGWIRSSTTQNPYSFSGQIEKYLFAYWSKDTEEPYSNWTKASVLLVSDTSNHYITSQNRHSWNWFKRWYYTCDDVSMNAGDTIIHNYLIQLGSENSSILPNIIDSSAANPIANAYIADPTPPDTVASVDNKTKSIPVSYSITQNYPNPFYKSTLIRYELPVTGFVSIKVFDFLGREIKTLVDEYQSAGFHELEWDGTDNKGNKVNNGIYFCQIGGKSGTSHSKKMIFLK